MTTEETRIPNQIRNPKSEIRNWVLGVARASAAGTLLALASCSQLQPEKRSAAAERVWKQQGFRDFVQGRFGDGGANTYVSAAGRVQTINRFDLNGDAEIDLVFANSHMQGEKLDSQIFWGNGKDFSNQRTSPVPNEGAQHCTAADLNGDGKMDLVVANYANGTWTKMPSAVYYGGGPNDALPGTAWNNAPFARKISLPSEAAQNSAVGDLNRDGFVDIIYAQSAGFWEYRGGDALASPSRIYWGAKDGFSAKSFLDIEAIGASDVAIADLNDDKWPDLVIANREKGTETKVNSFVYFGGEKGFSAERRAELPTNQANSVIIADVNGDKYGDIVFSNGKGNESYVYLNQQGTFAADRRIALPTSESRGCVAADFNGDGSTDVFFTNFQTAGTPLTHSYLYWGGSDGLKPDNRQTFETIGAWGCSAGDLNGDGRVDLVVSNYQEHTSYDIQSYIYWNTEKGLSNSMRTAVFTHGAVGNTIADFNGDGHADILFCNSMNRRRGGVTDSFVYWGNRRGQYSVDQRVELPGIEPYHYAGGDINDDGKTDLILVNMAEIGRRINESFIYWGGEGELFTPARRTALVTQGGRGARLADLDRDGYLDVVMFNQPPGQGAAGAAGQAALPPGTLPPGGVFIFWGAKDGFVTWQRTELGGAGSGLPQVADLNGDGNLDIVVPGQLESTLIYWGDGKRGYSGDRRFVVPESKGLTNSEIADMNRDGHLDLILTFRGNKSSWVYYGNGKGDFSADRRTPFTALETQGVTVGDLNQDGWLDIVAPAYKDGGSRATKSIVFWGGPEGVSDSRTLKLDTFGGTGSQIADYNHDGINDLLLVNHRSEGNPDKPGVVSDHCTDTYLYWGTKNGWSLDHKLLIPSEGSHYDSGTDIGHVADRKFDFDYISPTHQFGSAASARIEWKAQTPNGTRVKMQVRTAASEAELQNAPWIGGGGKDTYFDRSGGKFVTPAGHSWIQYRAVLDTRNGAGAPVLDAVTIAFQ